MSDDRTSLVARGEEFLRVFQRGAEFTRELLRENERLQRTLDCLEDAQQTAARSPEDWDKLRVELLGRLASLEDENTGDRERLLSAGVENPGFAGRHLEIEEENNNLASLYVASYQLHSTLEINEVIRIVIEIVIDLIGAEIFAIYLPDAKIEMLEVVASEGVDAAEIPGCRIGYGVFGEAVAAKRTTCWGIEPSADYTKPMVCIPLVIEDRPIGAIAIFKLFQQKDGFPPPRPRTLQPVGRTRGHRNLRGAPLFTVGEETEYDSGIHRPVDELTRRRTGDREARDRRWNAAEFS